MVEKAHSRAEHGGPNPYCGLTSVCARTCFLVLLSHGQNSGGTQCRDMKVRGGRNQSKVVIKSYQRVRESPEIQKETIKETINIFDCIQIKCGGKLYHKQS